MTQKQAGLTAVAMAYAGAYHATHDSPKIFDDFLAAVAFSSSSAEIYPYKPDNIYQKNII